MSEEIIYSRSDRRSYNRGRRYRSNFPHQELAFNHSFTENQLSVNWWLVFGWSFIVSVLCVANPYLTGLADNLQSQNLYAGFAMQQGQVPYTDFFGTSGVLYYLMLFLGSLFESTTGIAVLQGVLLAIAGIYLYKIIAYFSKSREMSNSLVRWFYIFILSLGFGGVYSSIFVLPFLLTSLWFLIRYFDNAVTDESFLFYGIDAALVFLIDSKTALLWLVAFPILAIYALQIGQKVRALYQFLVALFGFLFVLYGVGYYAFTQQILGKAIQQTVIQNLSLDFGNQTFVTALAALAVVIVLTGFFKGFLKTLVSLGVGQNRHLKTLVLFTFLVQSIFIVASTDFTVAKLLVLLPYGLIMGVIYLSNRTLGLATQQDELAEKRAFSYLKSNLFLPVFVCLYAPMTFTFHYLQGGAIDQERTEIAGYIRGNSDQADTLYVWDDSAQVYFQSQRVGVSKFITAKPYLTSKTNQDSLLFDLGKQPAHYVVVNTSIPLIEGIQSLLDTQYSKVDIDLGTLVLYQQKLEWDKNP